MELRAIKAQQLLVEIRIKRQRHISPPVLIGNLEEKPSTLEGFSYR
jgi:hypothetical protein